MCDVHAFFAWRNFTGSKALASNHPMPIMMSWSSSATGILLFRGPLLSQGARLSSLTFNSTLVSRNLSYCCCCCLSAYATATDIACASCSGTKSASFAPMAEFFFKPCRYNLLKSLCSSAWRGFPSEPFNSRIVS